MSDGVYDLSLGLLQEDPMTYGPLSHRRLQNYPSVLSLYRVRIVSWDRQLAAVSCCL